jgi:hypothetical protein
VSEMAQDPFNPIDRVRSDVRLLRSDVDRISTILEGKDGMQMQLTKLLTKLDILDQQRDLEHKANSAKLNIIIGVISALAAWVGIALAVWHHL